MKIYEYRIPNSIRNLKINEYRIPNSIRNLKLANTEYRIVLFGPNYSRIPNNRIIRCNSVKDFRILHFPCRGFLDFAKKGITHATHAS